ncbi:MAG: hypothetical protein R6W75_00300 [Smithellaceae bacterium]
MKKIILVISIALLCSCGSAQVPDWKDKGFRHLENYKDYFLSGREDVTEPHFLKARREIAASNDLNLLALAYLTKYALHAASLEDFDAADFAKLQRLEPNEANMAYCHFLKGNFSAIDARVLPARYAGVVKAALARDTSQAAREIPLIADPLSRLIACGVWVKYVRSDESILLVAVATASENGWRRPLWAYLAKLQSYYEERGEKARAEAVNERLQILKK